MDVSITVETDSVDSRTFTRALNIIQKDDPEALENWKLGWVMYSIRVCKNKNIPDKDPTLSDIQSVLIELDATPFDETLTEDEVEGWIKELEDREAVEKDGDWMLSDTGPEVETTDND